MTAKIWNGGLQGYWGARTSTLDWCEENYIVSYFIAEFWNTLTNIVIIFTASLGIFNVKIKI
jgi:dihydroceramidase